MTDTEAPAPPDENLTAVYASAGIVGEDAEAEPETQPPAARPGTSQREKAPAGKPSTETAEAEEATPADAADGPDGGDGSSDEDEAKAQPPADEPTDVEREVERRLQKALKEIRARDDEKARRTAQAQAERELRELFAKADEGDPEANQALHERHLADLRSKFSADEYQARLDQYGREKWEAHAAAFGLDPDDGDFAGDGGSTFQAINATAIRKTTVPDLLSAMLANPAVAKEIEARVAKRVEKAVGAAEKRTMAKALRSEDAPVTDTGKGVRGAVDDLDAIETRIADGTATADDYAAWPKLMKAAGQRGWG